MREKRAAIINTLSKTARAISNLWKVSVNSFLLMMMMVTVFPDIISHKSWHTWTNKWLPKRPRIPTKMEQTPSTQKENIWTRIWIVYLYLLCTFMSKCRWLKTTDMKRPFIKYFVQTIKLLKWWLQFRRIVWPPKLAAVTNPLFFKQNNPKPFPYPP